MDDTVVRVNLNPPREVTQSKASYWLEHQDCEPIQLPQKLTTIEYTEDGNQACAVNIPRYIAEDRGLLSSSEPVKETNDEFERWDRYRLAAMQALIIRGEDVDALAWDATKIADRMVERNEAPI